MGFRTECSACHIRSESTLLLLLYFSFLVLLHVLIIILGEINCLQSELERNSSLREKERGEASEEKLQNEKNIEHYLLEIRRLNAEAQTSLNNHKIHEEDGEKWQREREALNFELGLKDGEIDVLKNRMDGLVIENKKFAVLIGEKDGHEERLLSEIRSLELQLQEVKSEMEECRERVMNIERENEGLLETVKQGSKDLKITAKENAKMADILKKRNCEIEKNVKSIEELKENIQLQDSLIEKLKRERTEKEIEVAAELNKAKIKQKEREAENREKELMLKEELKKKESASKRLMDNVEELRVERRQMSHLLQERDTCLEKLKNKVIDLEQTATKKQDELERWKKKAEDVIREKEVLKNGHISVKHERDELAEQLRVTDKEIKKQKLNEQNLMSDHERMKEEQRQQGIVLKQRDRMIEEYRTTLETIMKERRGQEKLKMQLEDIKKERIEEEEKRNQLEEGEQKMKDEINVLKIQISEMDREFRKVERNLSEKNDQLQIQSDLLKEKEVDVKKLRQILEQKEQQENELMTLKEKLNETELVQEKEIKIMTELEIKNKSLTQEADMVRKDHLEQLRELETKSRLLQENEENVKRLKSRVECGEEEKKQLKRSLGEMMGEIERLKIELRKRKREEEKLRLEQQIRDLGEDLRKKDGVINALKQKTEFILKKKDEELKQAKKNKDTMSTKVTKLREELTVLSVSKKKVETMVKEQEIENKKIKDGLKAGLEEMVTLKELLKESHCEGEKLRKVLEAKKNEMIKGSKEEIGAAREEMECLKLRVQILQKENQGLQAQLWRREKNDNKINCEIKDIKRMELETQNFLKMTLAEDVKNKNDGLKQHELLKDEKNTIQIKIKDNSFELISEKLKEEESEINRMKNSLKEGEIEMEQQTSIFEVVRDKLGEKRETDTTKKEMKANEKIKHVEKQSIQKCLFATKVIPEWKTEITIIPTKNLIGEQLKDAQLETAIFKTQMEREEQNVMTNLEKNILVDKIHGHQDNVNTVVNPQAKNDFKMKESQNQTRTTKNFELQTEVYDLKKKADELRKDRDRLRKALEENEALLIHYQEKAKVEKQVQVRT